jgi:hypothetical protein
MADGPAEDWLRRGAPVRFIGGTGPTMLVGAVRTDRMVDRYAMCYWTAGGSIHALEIPEWLLEADPPPSAGA